LLVVAKAATEQPVFSAEACKKMGDTRLKLGGPVPEGDYLAGCDHVCTMIWDLKRYWKTGTMADYACEKGKELGCVFPGTPPKTMEDIKC